MEKFNVNACTKFSAIKELNSEFTLTKVYVMGCGKNRNMSYIGKDRVEANLGTLNYAPVVGHLFKNEDGKYVLGGHDCTFDDDWNLVSLCVPFGVVVENSFSWETVNEYGTDVDYLVCECILWTGRYPELKEAIYSEDVWFNQSMELNVQQYRPYEQDSNYLELLDFSFSALCLLNKSDNPEENVEPCFISARVEPINFSADEFTAKFEELKLAMSKCFDSQEEGEVNVVENTEMELNTEEIVEAETEQITEEVTVEVESEEVVEETAEVETEETTDEVETTEETVDYEAKYNDAISEIETLKAQIAELTQSVEALTPYKLAAEKAEREAAENDVFAKFDSRIGTMPEYVELKTKAGEYEIADLEKECLMLVGKFAMTATKTETEETETTPTITFALDDVPEKKANRYGNVYETYKTK